MKSKSSLKTHKKIIALHAAAAAALIVVVVLLIKTNKVIEVNFISKKECEVISNLK